MVGHRPARAKLLAVALLKVPESGLERRYFARVSQKRDDGHLVLGVIENLLHDFALVAGDERVGAPIFPLRVKKALPPTRVERNGADKREELTPLRRVLQLIQMRQGVRERVAFDRAQDHPLIGLDKARKNFIYLFVTQQFLAELHVLFPLL